eukprot:gnl/TRDRNA2_/TRDRNA2_41494_c0_seq2.p1 gnl/TRDRNA2_/TRDRNA2_41494_c0~~gnl/TRDRNA2_/TRDRNA2_41494_c0_seq2.p1  ORF type:complete len:212 (+),score=44.20 gnl/TRDRNA2_/TRDRNA2_41494_c0_seq2:55-690(+)
MAVPPVDREKRLRVANLLAKAMASAVASGPVESQSLGHPWVCEYLALQVESQMFADAARCDGADGGVSGVVRRYNARARALLKGVRLEENQSVLISLMEGRLPPGGLLQIQAAGILLPESQRKRLAEEADLAAKRTEQEVKAARWSSKLSFFSDKIRCPACEAWGARYERIPHNGGHHKLGKTASLSGTDGARLACQCTSCGRSWKTDEPA